MKPPIVCTAPTTHGRIVSLNPKALGASTSSRRIRREENHLIFAVGTNYHLCARTRYGRKMFTHYSFSRISSGVLFCGSGKILASGKAENASLYPRGSRSLSTTPHQSKRFPQTPAQVLDLILINLIYSLPEKILRRSQSPAHSAEDKKIGIGNPNPVVKSPIYRKSECAVVTLINLIYSLTEGSNFPIKNHLIINQKSGWNAHETPVYRRLSEIIGFEISLINSVHSPVAVCKDPSVLPASHNSIRSANVSCWAPDSRRTWEANPLATNYVTYGHIKSDNVNEFFRTTPSHQRRNASNSKNCQNKKSLNVTDSDADLIFSSRATAGSNCHSVLSPVAVCKDSSILICSHLIAQKSHNEIFQKSCTTNSTTGINNLKSLFSNRTPPSPTALFVDSPTCHRPSPA
jgi:hypothetical protein